MRKIPLVGKHGEGKFAKVDDDMYDYLKQFTWRIANNKYRKYIGRSVEKVANQPFVILLHREIVKAKKGEVVSFINRDRFDCRRKNLQYGDYWKNTPIEIDEATGAAKIRLTGAFSHRDFTLIDIEDWEKVIKWKWQLDKAGYATRTRETKVGKKAIKMHRVIMNAPDGMQVDHINGNRSDNRKINLRLVTHTQNQWNSKKKKRNKSGYKGVYQDERNGKWVVSVLVNGKKIYGKRSYDIIEAAKEYDRLAKKYFGEYAKTNF